MPDKQTLQPGNTGPRFFYGYTVVTAAFLIMVMSWGLYNAFGVFFKPLQQEFGWTSATTSGAFSLSMIIYGVLGVVVGGLNDRVGPRVVVAVCGFLIGLGYLLMSQVNALWHLYLFLGLIMGIGMSGVWVPQLSSVARWFVRRRSLMSGIVIAGAGIGQLVGPPVISRLIAVFEWRLSYMILGGTVMVAIVLLAQLLRRDPAQKGQQPYGERDTEQPGPESASGSYSFREAVNTVQFWLLLFILFCYGYGMFSFIVHIVPHAIELEISSIVAANILAISGGASILSNYLMGAAGDRIGNRQVFLISFLLMAASLFWLVPAGELWMLYLLAIVFGFGFGGPGTVESPLVAGLFGLRSHGLIYGVIHLGFTCGAAVGPFLTGYLFDLTGNYRVGFLVCGALSAAAIILTLVLRPTIKRKPAPRSMSV